MSSTVKNTDGRLRVLIVDPSGLLWGSERALLDLISHVDRSRFEIIVATPLDTELRPRLDALDVKVVRGDIGMLHRRGRVTRAKATGWLAMIIHRYEPRVIHVNEAGLTPLVVAARLAGTPPVVAHVRLWDDAVVMAGRPARFGKPQLLIAISNFIAEKLVVGSSLPVRVVRDPFDADAFSSEAQSRGQVRQAMGLSETDRVVLMVGRICREKGQSVFVHAAGILADDSVIFLVVGGVPPDLPEESQYRDSLVAHSRAQSFRGRVRFLGNRNDVASIMNASDIVVLASANEPFGRVLLEALSLGKPIIGPDRGGPIEIIGDNERGHLFATGDAERLSKTLRRVLDDPAGAAAKAAKGKEWVARECSPTAHAAQVQSIWEELSQPGFV